MSPSARLFIFLLLYAVGFVCIAQRRQHTADSSSYIEQPNRIEFMFEKNDIEFTVINGHENGLLVVKETAVRNEGGFGWVLYKLDTALQLEWTKLLIVPFEYSFKGWDYSDQKYYLLFAAKQYTQDDFSIYSIEDSKGLIEEMKFSTVFPILLSHFEVLGDSFILAGSVNYKPAVLTFNTAELKPRVLPGIYSGNSNLLEMYINDDANVFSIATIERLIDKKYTVSVKTYDTNNQMLQSHRVLPVDRKSIIDGAPTQFSSGVQYIAGAYSYKSPDYSRGLYLSMFLDGEQQFIKFYNYAELSNFFGYMGSRREQRVQERIVKRREKGKKNRFNYRLLVHDIIRQGDHFLLIGEAYYPRYSTYQNLGPYVINRTSSMGYVTGYKITHAIVVAFDANGNMLWDHSFPIQNVFKDYLTETVQVIAKKDRVELHYLEENTIRSKVVIGDEVIEGESFTPVRLDSEKDQLVIKDPEVEGLERWYEDMLYAYGEQMIEHEVSQRVRTKRDVFYINKVRYNPKDTIQ